MQQYWSLAAAGRGGLLRWEWLHRSLITKWRRLRDRWERGGAMVVSTATEMGRLAGTSRGRPAEDGARATDRRHLNPCVPEPPGSRWRSRRARGRAATGNRLVCSSHEGHH